MQLYEMRGNPGRRLVLRYEGETKIYLDQKARNSKNIGFDVCFRVPVADWINPKHFPLEFMGLPREPDNNPFADIIALTTGHHFALSPKGYEVLAPYLKGNVEELLFEMPEGYEAYRVFNVICYIDALDKRNSIRGRAQYADCMAYLKTAFNPDKVKVVEMFLNTEPGLCGVLVKNTFVRDVLDAGLTGFWFNLMWDSKDPDYVWDLRKHPRNPKNDPAVNNRTKAGRAQAKAWLEHMEKTTRIKT